MKNYEFMNYAVAHTDGNEFRVLYFIANTLRMKNANRCRIYNEVISDYLNMDKRTVMRMTKKLEEKGLIKKDLIYDENGKSKVLYSLNYDVLSDKVGTDDALILDKTVTDNALILDRTVTLNSNIYKNKKKIYNNINNNIKEVIHNKNLKQGLDPNHNNINSNNNIEINSNKHNNITSSTNSTITRNKPDNLKDLQEYFKIKIIESAKHCKTVEDYQHLKDNVIQELECEYNHIPSYTNCMYSINGYITKKIEDLCF